MHSAHLEVIDLIIGSGLALFGAVFVIVEMKAVSGRDWPEALGGGGGGGGAGRGRGTGLGGAGRGR